MTEETEKNNDLIAKFMELPKCNRCEDCGGYIWGPVVFTPKQMEYNKSWDWLMPVVKNIMDSDVREKESDGWYAYGAIETFLACVDIDKVYENVIKYIKWINSKN